MKYKQKAERVEQACKQIRELNGLTRSEHALRGIPPTPTNEALVESYAERFKIKKEFLNLILY